MVYGNQSSDICYSAAVNVCENCGASCDTLIDLPSWNFKACEACAEEATREDERETLRSCVNCKTKPARWDSIYCSDCCKSAFIGATRRRDVAAGMMCRVWPAQEAK